MEAITTSGYELDAMEPRHGSGCRTLLGRCSLRSRPLLRSHERVHGASFFSNTLISVLVFCTKTNVLVICEWFSSSQEDWQECTRPFMTLIKR